jgi:pimeloyl-ACP methyl ester carboxylesterase
MMSAIRLITLVTASLLSLKSFAGMDLVRLPDLTCEPAKPECFQKAKEFLQTSTDPIHPFTAYDQDGNVLKNKLYKTYAGNPRSMSYVPRHRALGSVVLIHGLWGSTEQFSETAVALARQGYAVILVTLPGHGGQWERGKEVRAEDWLEETRRAIKLASALGDKVIIGGQSTGGMLAVMSALDHRNQVDGMVLMEPAVHVQAHLTFATCAARHIVDQAADVPELTKAIAKMDPCTFPAPVFLNLGCEVHHLRDIAIRKYLDDAREDVYGNRLSDEELSKELGELIKVPTFLYTNNGDKVVSNRDNLQLLGSLLKNQKDVGVAVLTKNHGTTSPENAEFSDRVLDVLKAAYSSPAKTKEIEKISALKKDLNFIDSIKSMRTDWVGGLVYNEKNPLGPFKDAVSLFLFKHYMNGPWFATNNFPACIEAKADQKPDYCDAVANWNEARKTQSIALGEKLKKHLPELASEFDGLGDTKKVDLDDKWFNDKKWGDLVQNNKEGISKALEALHEYYQEMLKENLKLYQAADRAVASYE